MASFWYTRAKLNLANGTLDLDTDDIRVILVDTTSTCGTEPNVGVISGFATLGELSGAGYVRKALQNKLIQEDQPNLRAELHSDNLVYTSINAGTIAAMVFYKHVVDDDDSVPILYNDSGDLPKATNGGTITIQKNAEGWGQLA